MKLLGDDPALMAPQEKANYIAAMVLEMQEELHEMLMEITGWKRHHKEVFINRDAAVGELRDAFQYFLNIMLALQLGHAEMSELLVEKQAVNLTRMGNVLDRRCGICRVRSLDDGGPCGEELCPR